jgi:UDP-N-acetylglucosamine--N-acetylmuramyl-(pentapeptide) pyrophosphoryl-undecaprenol N-acetylglucosamine transferase
LAINQAVAGWLDRAGPREADLIWVTGRTTYEQFRRYEAAGVRVFDFLDPMSDAYAVADLVVSRAGMITLAELCAWGIPALLVPLPTAAADHQSANARALATSGAARQIPQRELTVERIDREVRALLDDPSRLEAMARVTASRGRPDAAEQIAKRVLALAHAQEKRA